MYSGPGAAPLLAASSAWEKLSTELYSAAAAYSSAISGLVKELWLGPSSVSMAAAAGPYLTWMKSTAAQAQQTAVQARSAAAAYQDAYLMTVPPTAVAANRALHASLVATNLLGQNTSAIAATEALYSEMWAQDAAAMYGYAARSEQAAAVPAFASAPQVANPAAPATQASAVAQSTATNSATGAGPSLTQLASALAGITGPGSGSGGSGFPVLDTIGDIAGDLSAIGFMGEAGLWMGAAPPFMAEAAVWIVSGGLMIGETFMSSGFSAGALASEMTPSTLASTGLAGSGLGVHGAPLSAASAVSAEMGQSPGIRGLSVPQAWASAVPQAWASAVPEAHLARAAALTSTAAAPTMAGTPVLGAVPLAGSASSPLTAGSAGGGLRGMGEARTADADAAYSSRHGYLGADPRTAKELREVEELREQNARLKRLLADAELEKDALRKAARGKYSSS